VPEDQMTLKEYVSYRAHVVVKEVKEELEKNRRKMQETQVGSVGSSRNCCRRSSTSSSSSGSHSLTCGLPSPRTPSPR